RRRHHSPLVRGGGGGGPVVAGDRVRILEGRVVVVELLLLAVPGDGARATVTRIEVAVGEQGAAGVSFGVDAVAVGGIADERGAAGGRREDAGRHVVPVVRGALVGVSPARVEDLVGGGV